MNYRKTALILIVVISLALSGCKQSASTSSTLPTPTIVDSILPSGSSQSNDPMKLLQDFATQTALAGGAGSQGGSSPTPNSQVTANPNANPLTPSATINPLNPVTVTSTPSTTVGGLPTVTPGVVIVITSVPPTAGPRPATYTLQSGEHPYCIARRYNIDPDELLTLNGISPSQTFDPGYVLKIPQSTKPFPASRALKAHPATYTVGADESIYSIACKYGDVEPMAIAAANGLTAPYTLRLGQVLNIP